MKSVALGYPAGILMAKYKDGVFDKIGKTYIISIDAIPGVAYYYIWMVILCTLIGLPRTYEEGNFLTMLAPALTMGFTGMAGIALWVRRFMLDEFNSDYVKFARAKGLSENKVIFKHALRNAINPMITLLGFEFAGLLSGAALTEYVFQFPGLGRLILEAVMKSDINLVMASLMMGTIMLILGNLIADILLMIADPRIRASR